MATDTLGSHLFGEKAACASLCKYHDRCFTPALHVFVRERDVLRCVERQAGYVSTD